MKGLFQRSLLTALISLAASTAAAIPTQIVISGYLTEPGEPIPPLGIVVDVPVEGTFTMRVTFFGEEGATESLGGVDTEATVLKGRLNAPIDLPETLLTLDELWYRVAIDLDQNGFDEGDVFGGWHQITAVPFALSVQPSSYFESHGGTGGLLEFGAQIRQMTPGQIVVTPFSAPPGGMLFNRMAASISHQNGDGASFGVYDSDGTLLYTSPLFDGNGGGIHVYELSGALKPSRIYYTAYTASGGTVRLGIALLPSMPTRGYYYSDVTDRTLPLSIDIGKIQFASDFRPVSIAFYQVANDDPANLRAHQGKGISYEPAAKE